MLGQVRDAQWPPGVTWWEGSLSLLVFSRLFILAPRLSVTRHPSCSTEHRAGPGTEPGVGRGGA